VVGISDLMPKLVAYRIRQPALTLSTPVHFVCYEGSVRAVASEFSGTRIGPGLDRRAAHSAVRVRVFSHLLGSSDIALFAAPALGTRYRKDFPARLDGAPFLMPMQNSATRRTLDKWLDAHGIHPLVVGEFQDRALLNVFGQPGVGIFASPAVGRSHRPVSSSALRASGCLDLRGTQNVVAECAVGRPFSDYGFFGGYIGLLLTVSIGLSLLFPKRTPISPNDERVE
jgi:hypothetical protein